MNQKISSFFLAGALLALAACQNETGTGQSKADNIKPVIVTQPVKYDTDDPAIWINPVDSSQSLVLGTDKEEDGALYVFDLDGKIIEEKVIRGLKRPNNVDVEYGLLLGGKPIDIAVVTERFTHKIRIYSLPDMKPVDDGGIEMFVGETGTDYRDLMGIALYKDTSGKISAIVGRKSGPTAGSYLWQYEISDRGDGRVKATLMRKFGKFSGRKEIESIAVDDKMGYVYYSDEGFGVRKYYADPAKGNEELASFGQKEFAVDNEGISFYETSDSTGYILVSDQGVNHFNVYAREGMPGMPHHHTRLYILPLSTLESDGSEMVSVPLNKTFQKGLFVAMSTDRTFHYYRWEDLEARFQPIPPNK